MHTKHYEFTKYEIYALREALEHFYFELRDDKRLENAYLGNISPLATKIYLSVKPLYDQLKEDVRFIKE